MTDAQLTHPSSFGLPGFPLRLATRGGSLGAWLLHPPATPASPTLLLYCHGVTGTRGAPLRLATYRLALNMGWTVLTFDYRWHCTLGGEESVLQGIR